MNRKHAYWLCQGLGWFAFALVGLAFGYVFESLSWRYVSAATLNVAIGFALTHGWRWQMRERAWLGLPLRAWLPRVLLTSVVLAMLWIGATLIVNGLLLGPSSLPASALDAVLLTMWFNWQATLLIWALLYCGVYFFENHQRAEVQKWQLEAAIKAAELNALKAQLNPHFLFNALNSIRALMVEDPARGQDAVTKLSGILRYSLQTDAKAVTPLREEMRFVRDYLALEAIRFDERLRVEMQLEEAALDCAVPPMIVQTLVENAVKHGVAPRHLGGKISVSAQVRAEKLCIRVSNEGRLSDEADSTRLGLANAAERLHLLFGAQASLALHDGAHEIVIAELTLPAQIISGADFSEEPDYEITACRS